MAPHTYLLGSMIMGSLQVADALVLQKLKGRIPLLALIFSLSEYLWAFVSFRAWQAADAALPAWLPLSFIAYVAAFFVIGLVLASRKRDAEFAIPAWASIAGGMFGLYFAAAAAWL